MHTKPEGFVTILDKDIILYITCIQTSANRPTGCRYSSKTRRLGNNLCKHAFDKSMVISCLDPDLNNYFMTQLLFDLDIRTLIFASRTKLESGPRFTKICLFFWCFISYYKECLSVKIWGLHSQMPFPGTGYFPKKCRKFPVLSIREYPIPSPD